MDRIATLSKHLAPFGAAATATLLLALACGVSAASAAEPWWHVSAVSRPTALSSKGRLVAVVTNLGDAAVEGSSNPVRITDTLPSGITATRAEAPAGAQGAAGSAQCTVETATTVTCVFSGTLPSYESIEMEIEVSVASSPPTESVEHGQLTVTGGGAQPVSVDQPVKLSVEPTPFGVEGYAFAPEEEGGAADTQAGSHPFQVTTVLNLNQGPVSGANHREMVEEQPALPRNFSFRLPAGFIGNPNAVPQCSEARFAAVHELVNECPAASAVGVAAVTIIERNVLGLTTIAAPVFNLVPAAGEPARLGFTAAGVPVVLDTAVRPGDAYGVTVNVENASETASVLGSVVTLWGVPGDPRHDAARGTGCVDHESGEVCARPEGLEESTFLRLPTSCGAQEQAPMSMESWPILEGGVPTRVETGAAEAGFGPLDGCNRVPFEPGLEVAPSGGAAASPVGVTVRVHVPQGASAAPEGIAEADVRNTTVSLPPALQVNPSAAAKLKGCGEQEIGYERMVSGEPVFSEESEAEKSGEVPHGTGCAKGSGLGTVQVVTPLLKEPLVGKIYQAAQDANPFGSLLAVYIVAEAPKAGVRVRLAGEVKVQPDGQLVSRFPQTPQTPFEDFAVKFFEGPKAPLATTGCGRYTTTSAFEPWSSTPAEPVVAQPSTFFEVTSGPEGGPCSGLGGFAPAFVAGTIDRDGGAFSPLTLTLTRRDGEQPLSAIAMRMPPGLAGMISKVTPCPEPQASAGTCPSSSRIGRVQVRAGVGSQPITLPQPGKGEDPVFLTGPYKGAPFGVSVVVPAEAGPFNLGTVVVRGKILVDPHTAQVSIESDPAPTRLQSIPLDVRDIEVLIDKPGFVFNPTNCSPMRITGTIGSGEGASEAVSSWFQTVNCATLAFKPGFKAFTKARHTKRFGAFLRVKLTSGPGQANIRSVFVKLPKALPSRVATLKGACSEAQFARNPAGCPAASHVGTVIARTPVLPVPLTGPAIFVSHGGVAFPDLDFVLQGDGVTIVQTGLTNIRKGITSSDFASVPDVPLSSVEVTLPTGPHSSLAANGNLCFKTVKKGRHRVRRRVKLVMPTTITGQNGAVVKQSTHVAVEGCRPKHG
jgi:hypothetical protein